MRILLVIVILFSGFIGSAQNEGKLESTIKGFHRALVEKNMTTINQLTDNELSYGHSNGWVETRNDLIKNLETGYMVYSSFREDSLVVKFNGNVAHARFIADINAIRDGKEGVFHLKVLEIWIKKKKQVDTICEAGSKSLIKSQLKARGPQLAARSKS